MGTRPVPIAENLAAVRARIARAAARAGRTPESVRLVAVSKTFSLEHVRAAADAGQRDFGENRVQEALGKMADAPDLGLRWHLIGHLQSNKARAAAAAFTCIDSVDSVDLLRKLDAAADTLRASPEALIQVDLAREPTKHGAPVEHLADMFAAASQARALRVRGLMLLPPFAENPEEARPYFQELRAVRERLMRDGVPADQLTEMSMGMSHDFEVAIEEGATMVRIGSAIFGSRHV